MKTTTFLFAAAAAAGLATAAHADTELQIDVNSLVVSTSGGSGSFGADFTGSLEMNDGPESNLAGLLCDGMPLGIDGTLSDFSGTINLQNGTVSGGSFTIEVTESGGGTNSYMAQIASGVGSVEPQAGQGFQIDGLTFQGMFSSDTFAGADVSPWFGAQPLPGSFLTFQFEPNANGVDDETDIDIFVVIPLPAGGAMASAALVGLAGVRRRRLG
jgi:hypothetical protein